MGCLNLPKVIIGGGWRFSIEIRAALGYALAFWQGALALKHRRGASADAEMNLQLAGERIKSCGTIRAVCAACFTFFPFFLFFLFFFFFFSSDRVESPTHRHYWKMQDRVTQGGDAGRAAWKLFIRLNYQLDEYAKKREKERKGVTEEKRKREREREKKKRVHCPCALRDLGNGKWERGERDYHRETLSRASRPERVTLWV